jgi:hypothetical protein
MSVLILIETEKMKSDIRFEVKQMKRLQAELKALKKEKDDE